MTAALSEAYLALEAKFSQRHHLGEAQGILGWDRQTLMPQGAADARAETMAVISTLSHALLTGPDTADLLAAASDDPVVAADPWRAANLREMRRVHARASALPSALVAAMSKAEAAGEMAWRAARKDDDFPALAPALEEIFRLQREAAGAVGAALNLTPYDALLDQFEPGARADRIDRLFDDLATFLPELIDAALTKQAATPAAAAPEGPFPIDVQKRLGLDLMQAVGFDLDRGRLDVSLHPFCGGADDDVRITTRYDEDDFSSALMGVLHETGHALYEQGLPGDWRRAQPVGRSRGMAIHESQSLLIEMQICRSDAFLAFAAPRFRAAFGVAAEDPAWSLEGFQRRYRRVARSLIRVDADEATYPAHVILRYRLEKALLSGDLPVSDLPGAWAEQMSALVGVVPKTDREGCLQDIHWPSGAIGYFPTYTLGALAAAQMREALERDLPDLWAAVAEGRFAPLAAWLRAKVHGRASLEDSDDLMIHATGAPLDTAAFKRHLRVRYVD